MTEEDCLKHYGMTKEEYMEKYFNKVDNLTAICRSTSTWAHGEYQELEIGKTYHVSHIGVLRSSSNLMLDNYGDNEYNAGCFDLCENGEPIGRKYTKDPRFLAPYLREMMRVDRYPYFEKEIEEIAIPAHLRSIEKEYDVRILLAVDFGSRAWGVESKDSDWDLRIIYVHKPEWYKRDGQHDVIEHVYENCIDVVGWDVRKALNLLKKGNLSLLEWINSPKVYYIDDNFAKRIHSIEKDLFSSASAIRYYNQFYEKNNESILQNDFCETKLFLYILRGILSCKWIEEKGSLPPVSLNDLIDATIDDVDTRNKVNTIIKKKKEGKDDGVLVLIGFIRQLADQYKVRVKSLKYIEDSSSAESLDILLLDTIRGNTNFDTEEWITSSNREVIIEILNLFQGKNNVRHIISVNGTVSWLTQERSFGDEAYNTGACKLNTVENEKKHVLFLFNDKSEEVGRYYLGKRLQGMTPKQLVEKKYDLVFFESWNPESKSWVPCVGLSDNTQREKSPTDISNNNTEKDQELENDIKEDNFDLINKLGLCPLYARLEIKKRKLAIDFCNVLLSKIENWEILYENAKKCISRSPFYGYKIVESDLSTLEKSVFFWKVISIEIERSPKEFYTAFPEQYQQFSEENFRKLYDYVFHSKHWWTKPVNVSNRQSSVDAETAIMSALENGDGDNYGF